jgi:2-keto-4-pentenoate hydratase
MSDLDQLAPPSIDESVAPVISEPPWAIEQLVERLVAARRGGDRLTAERVMSAVKTSEQAYRVQSLVHAVLWPGAEATVWKAGADSRDSLPTAAPIVPSLVFENGATLSSPSFPVRIVEAEIAYRFGIDLPPRDIPYSTDEVLEAVETMHAAIEVVTPRIVDFQTASSSAKLADHGINGAFVLGDSIKSWRKIDLRKQKATLSFQGKVQQSVEGSHALGNPSVLLPWFVAHLGRLPTWDDVAGPPRGVKAGDVVTTGSWTKVIEAKPKQRVEVEFPGIGRASLSFAV